MSRELALAAKGRGNAAFSKGDFETAITEFTEAIKQDATDHVFYSNRSGAYASLSKYDEALTDATKCVETKPSWAKGYSRKGLALLKLKKVDEAKAAYEEGLKLDANNAALKEGLADCERALNAKSNPMGELFGEAMWGKLAADPTTREYLNDPAFVQKLKQLQANPQLFGSFASDPKMSAALGVILGMGSGGFQSMNPGGGDGPQPMEDVPAEKAAPKKKAKPEPEPVQEMTEEEKKAESDKKEAEGEKLKGNAAYKKRNFEEALQLYGNACRLDPTNSVYLNNTAAVYLEQKNYDKCESVCRGAIELETKKPRYNYTLVAKSYVRLGNCLDRAGKLEEAAEAYQKALLEDYNDSAKKALKRVKAKKIKLDQEGYLSEELSEVHKSKGNEHFKEQRWQAAIEEYTEALKRNPKNYKVLSNRAFAFSKLMSWGQGMEDCDKCIAIEPTFVKAYIRKGKIQHFLKNYMKALETFDKGLKLDPTCTDLIQARSATMGKINQENASGEVDPERAKEAMKDPEIQAILRDPMVNQVLQSMQENPQSQSAQAGLKDPTIRSKIEKLVAAGILRMG